MLTSFLFWALDTSTEFVIESLLDYSSPDDGESRSILHLGILKLSIIMLLGANSRGISSRAFLSIVFLRNVVPFIVM